MKNKDIDFEKLITVFNNEGKEAVMEYVKNTYNTSYAVIQRRIKVETNYHFNKNTRKYELTNKEQTPFMTLEELYKDNPKTITTTNEDRSNIDLNPHQDENLFKDVVVNLMKDRIQEISKYIQLEQSTKSVLISLKKLVDNGYKVILN